MALSEIINLAREKKVAELLCLYEEKYHKAILANFKQLVKEEFGFYTDDPSQFPDLDLYWDHPAIVSNAIIDWSDVSTFKTKKVNDFVETLGCEAVQIIIPNDIEKTEAILKRFNKKRVKSIELLTDYVSEAHSKKLVTLAEKYLRIFFIRFYSSREYKDLAGKHNIRITFINNTIRAVESYKIKVDRWPFIINIPFFTESQKHHTYFNRKIYIANNGDVRNAPECEEIFGNINSNNTGELIEAIKKESNQKYWHVSKDKCDVCKNCEFRYMCMDNRIPYQRLNGEWYHKEECNYNPYIAKWKDEEGYKNLNECGILSDENWFFIDYNKVEKINKEIRLI